jgi:hypothetical protein
MVHDLSPTLKRVRCALALTIAAFLSVCKADSTVPVHEAPKLVIVAHPTTADTIQARPTQPLVIEIRGVDGKPQPNVIMRFTALPSTDPTQLSDTTASLAYVPGTTYSAVVGGASDAQGRVKVFVGFGKVTGAAGIEMEVPELAIRDTFTLNVLPGAPAHIKFAVPDTLVSVGARYSLGASVADRFKNSIAGEPVTLTAASPNLSVDASGNVTAGASGLGYVVGRFRSVADTARVSIVPAGVKIVWYRAGVLSMSSLDGSNATILARSSHTSTYPHAAPGGQLVAFYEENANVTSTISVASATGVRLVASAGAPAWPRWSADGQWIYFTVVRDTGIGVSRMHADGSSVQRIGPSVGWAPYNAVGISPDGKTVVVQGGTALTLIDVNTGALRQLSISCSMPQFSPDGRRIACVTDATVRVVNADGTNERVVATRPLQTVGGVDWSPDGAWLLISGPIAPELVSVLDGSSIVLTPLSGGNLTQAAFVP